MESSTNGFYHFTGYDLWRDVIRREGLVPQPIIQTPVKGALRKLGLRGLKGFWIWMKVDKKLVVDFFVNKRVLKRINRGILLGLDLVPPYLLSEMARSKNYNPHFTHDLCFHADDYGDVVFHKDVPFDIYTKHIPPTHITPLMEVGFKVKELEGGR